MFNQNFLDTMAIMSFVVGLANYDENLTQSDKDDLIKKLDQQTKDILVQIEESLEQQNNMLREILSRLEKLDELQGHESRSAQHGESNI